MERDLPVAVERLPGPSRLAPAGLLRALQCMVRLWVWPMGRKPCFRASSKAGRGTAGCLNPFSFLLLPLSQGRIFQVDGRISTRTVADQGLHRVHVTGDERFGRATTAHMLAKRPDERADSDATLPHLTRGGRHRHANQSVEATQLAHAYARLIHAACRSMRRETSDATLGPLDEARAGGTVIVARLGLGVTKLVKLPSAIKKIEPPRRKS